ncbi:MAG: glycosyltransferase family 4 protein [Dehalococcoidia bacterium]|nr:glycosyltransferase family 4 protein [Dehalococcoidia bacterium]
MAVLIKTTENSGLDRYSRELAKRLPVRVVETGRYALESDGYGLIRILRDINELVHFTNQHFGRISLAINLPSIVTVHDLERICFPVAGEAACAVENLKKDVLAIKQAVKVIAVSDHTKKDLIRCLSIPEDRIVVIHNGVDHTVFRPYPDSSEFPYILYVGSERPRKNLLRFFEAFAMVKKQAGFAGVKLIKIGSPGRSDEYRQATLAKLKELGIMDDVVFIPHVDDEQLAKYYSAAMMLVYPSLYEGFGLPVIEAMACGCPVIASNIAALPETSGGAALLVDPYNPADMAAAITSLLDNRELREQLTAKGIVRARDFDWADTAEKTLMAYRQI